MLLKIFWKSRKKQVVSNDQHSSWRNLNAGVPQELIRGPLFFLVYINDFPPNTLKYNPNISAYDTSLFSVIHEIKLSQIDLNGYLDKNNNLLHPPLTFNNVDVGQIRSEKHLGVFLDVNLGFNKHLEKFQRDIAILWKLQSVLLREALLTIHKLFICSHFGYGD